MNEFPGRRAQGPSRLNLAIYDMPSAVSGRLSGALASAGYSVLFEGRLDDRTACDNADVWITKWSFGLKHDFLKNHHPRLGFISATAGVDHIDRRAMAELGLRADNCPTFSSVSVAEHALALAFRGASSKCILPPLREGRVIFSEFSDDYAERAIAQVLMRSRQMEKSIERARSYEYLDSEGLRPSEPWSNSELSNARIGIIGREREAFLLSGILKYGFDCDIYGYDTPEELAGFGVKPDGYLPILEHSDYIFLCTSRYGPRETPWSVDARTLPSLDMSLLQASVGVLGTGAIGSIISRICAKGFGCLVSAFSRSQKAELLSLGVRYPDPEKPAQEALAEVLGKSDFIFVALPLNEGTQNLITAQQMEGQNSLKPRILVNVTRDKIVDSAPLYDFISRGLYVAYATDVVPNDFVLCSGGIPDEMTQKFLQHRNVIPTPHEGECSKNALERLAKEVLVKLNNFMM